MSLQNLHHLIRWRVSNTNAILHPQHIWCRWDIQPLLDEMMSAENMSCFRMHLSQQSTSTSYDCYMVVWVSCSSSVITCYLFYGISKNRVIQLWKEHAFTVNNNRKLSSNIRWKVIIFRHFIYSLSNFDYSRIHSRLWSRCPLYNERPSKTRSGV